MQDDLYPPGMAPASGRQAAPKARPKPQQPRIKPVQARPADLLPPGATDPEPSQDEPSEFSAILPEAALPPEIDVPAPASAPATPQATAGMHPLKVSTAPSAARITKQRDQQATRFLLLTILGSAALVTIVGVGYLLINRNRITVQVEAPPTRVERPPPATSSSARRPSAPARSEVPVVVQSTEPKSEEPTSSNQQTTDLPETTASSPAMIPAPEPPPPEKTPPVTISRAEVEQLIESLQAAKTALSEANFQAAESSLNKAVSQAKIPQHKATVSRLKEISGHVRKFHDGVKAAAQGMQAGETFKVGASTQVSFVEAKADRVILRIAGMNKTYPLNDLPPGLALALAEFKLPSADPASNVIKGAYLLVHKRADSETRDKAQALWQQAQSSGVNLAHLLPFLDDDYAKLTKDATG